MPCGRIAEEIEDVETAATSDRGTLGNVPAGLLSEVPDLRHRERTSGARPRLGEHPRGQLTVDPGEHRACEPGGRGFGRVAVDLGDVRRRHLAEVVHQRGPERPQRRGKTFPLARSAGIGEAQVKDPLSPERRRAGIGREPDDRSAGGHPRMRSPRPLEPAAEYPGDVVLGKDERPGVQHREIHQSDLGAP